MKKGCLLVISTLLLLSSCVATKEVPVENFVATWTPIPHATSEPLTIEAQLYQSFGDLPLLAFFFDGGAEKSSVEIANLTTEDVYDDSALKNVSTDGWNRPLMLEDKTAFLQIQNQLFILKPDERTEIVEIPYNQENPVFCSWFVEEKLYCLSNDFSEGFTLDSDKEVNQLTLPAQNPNFKSDAYSPFKLENGKLRSIQKEIVDSGEKGSRFIYDRDVEFDVFFVSFRDFDFVTGGVEEQSLNMEYYPDTIISSGWRDADGTDQILSYTRAEGIPHVRGINSGLDKLYLDSFWIVEGHDYIEKWVEEYVFEDGLFVTTTSPGNSESGEVKQFFGNSVITDRPLDQNGTKFGWPQMIDLDTAKDHLDIISLISPEEPMIQILPYGDNYLICTSDKIYHTQMTTIILQVIDLPEEMSERFGENTTYTITNVLEMGGSQP